MSSWPSAKTAGSRAGSIGGDGGRGGGRFLVGVSCAVLAAPLVAAGLASFEFGLNTLRRATELSTQEELSARTLGVLDFLSSHGLDGLRHRFGEHIVVEDLLPIGAPRRNWRQTLLSDGYLVVRHPELAQTLEIADAVGTDLQIDAR